MTALRVFWARLRAWLHKRPADERLRDEIQEHLDMLASDFEHRGMSPHQAQLAARRTFGAVTQMEESHREQRSLPLFDTLLQDLRYALRQMAANPGFAAAAVLTLALGIGANTAIFRVLDVVVLRSLPVRDPQQLVILHGTLDDRRIGFSYPLLREFAKRQDSFAGVFATTSRTVATTISDGSSRELACRLVTGGYFHVLGVNAAVGRPLTEDDERTAAPAVAVVSYTFWQRAFGGRDDVIGRTLRIQQAVATIVGVAPRNFYGEQLGDAPDVWLPLTVAPQLDSNWLDSPGVLWLTVMARLRPDVSLRRAQASSDTLFQQLRGVGFRVPGRNDWRLTLVPGSQGLRELQERFSQPLRVLMGIVALVLLIASCNLANLLLARAAARTHEIGVRLALGASRGRVARQLLTESLLLAVLGGALGFAMAAWGSRELVFLASAGQSWKLPLDSGARVLLFTTSVSVLALCLFGLAPALAGTKVDLRGAMQSSWRGPGGTRSRRLALRGLVIAQLCVSLVLVSGASILVRSFWNLAHQDFGYRAQDLLLVRLSQDFLALHRLPPQTSQAILERMNTLPGVRSAAVSAFGPFADLQQNVMLSTAERLGQGSDDVHVALVSPGYFETMGIPILAGRAITSDDRTETNVRMGPPAPNSDSNAPATSGAVLSETAARLYFGRTNPIGRLFSLGQAFDARHAIQVVGVSRDVRYSGPRDSFSAVAFVPLSRTVPLSSIALRIDGDPGRVSQGAMQALRETDPTLKVAEIRPLTDWLDSKMGQEKMMALLSGAFALLALLLASVGLYGLISYGVEQRTSEIGIRLALGASRAGVASMLLKEVMLVLGGGLLLGGAGALALGRYVQSLLFGLTANDPLMLASACTLLALVCLVAGFLPARRAALLDPMDALRQE